MTSADIVARYRIRNHVARDADAARASRPHRARHRDLDRSRLRRRRPQDRHRADRAAPDGGLLRRPQGGGAGLRRRRDDAQPARRGDARRRRRPGAASTAIRSTTSWSTSRAGSASTSSCDVSIDRARRLTGVFAGDLEQAHAAGVRVRRARTCASTSTARPTSSSPRPAAFRSTTRTTSRSRAWWRRSTSCAAAARSSWRPRSPRASAARSSSTCCARRARHDDFMARITSPRLLQHRPVDGAAPLPGAAQGRGDPGQRRRCAADVARGLLVSPRADRRGRAGALPRALRPAPARRRAAAGPLRARHRARPQAGARPAWMDDAA